MSLTRRDFVKSLGLAASASCLAGCTTTASNTSSSNTVKVLSCNIRVPTVEADVKAGDGWEARKAMCADVILAQRADLIGYQECFGSQLDYLKERMPQYDTHGLAGHGEIFNPMNAIMYLRSRYQLISAGGFWLSQTPHVEGSRSWDSANPRFTNWVHLKDRKSGRELRFWNTHFDHKGQVAREEQARVLCEGCETPHPTEFPQLLTGDMNADVTNRSIAVLKERGWNDTYAEVHGPKDPGFTFHGFQGPKHAARMADRPRQLGKIDWIFSRGAVKAVAAEIIRDHRNGRYPSDHYFISAEVALG